jgi:hypothetical protein
VFTSDSFLEHLAVFRHLGYFRVSPVHLLSLLSLLNQLFKKEFKISFLENAEQAEQAEQVHAHRKNKHKGKKSPPCARKESDVNTGGAKGATSARKTPWRQGGRWVPLPVARWGHPEIS